MRIHHTRAAARTVLHGVIVTAAGLLLAAPEIYRAVGGDPATATGVIGAIIALSAVVARLMAVPALDGLLRRIGISVEQIHDVSRSVEDDALRRQRRSGS